MKLARDELVYCRTCGARIARSAKRCPYCGARQKKRHVFRNVILFFLVLCIVYYVYDEGMARRSSVNHNSSSDQTPAVTAATEKQTDTSEKESSRRQAESDVTASAQAKAGAGTGSGMENQTNSQVQTERVDDGANNQNTQLGADAAHGTRGAASDSSLTDSQPETDENGVSVDFKEFMDSYESFMNEYCDFMATYNESDLSALARYLSLVSKYTDFASKVDSYNEDNLSAADYKYYIDVMARVNKKLIDASVTIDQQSGE